MNERLLNNSLFLTILDIEDGDTINAEAVLTEMIEQVEQGEDAEQILYDYGLEPDYVIDLINLMQPY